MKKLAAALILLTSFTASSNAYLTVGVGYKFQESQLHYFDDNGQRYEWNDPYSARIEVGYNYNENIKFGVSHHSQWATGKPFNMMKMNIVKLKYSLITLLI